MLDCCEMSRVTKSDSDILFMKFLRKMVGCILGTCLVLRGIRSKRARFLVAGVKARWPGRLFTVNLDKSLFLFLPPNWGVWEPWLSLWDWENYLFEREGRMKSIPLCAENQKRDKSEPPKTNLQWWRIPVLAHSIWRRTWERFSKKSYGIKHPNKHIAVLKIIQIRLWILTCPVLTPVKQKYVYGRYLKLL